MQQIEEEEVKVQLESLRLSNTTLIWWGMKLQKGSKHNGKLISSWSEFTSTLRKLFYPLGYIQKAMMEWKNLREGKGQSVQEYTQEFSKRYLVLGIPLYIQETSQVYRRIT